MPYQVPGTWYLVPGTWYVTRGPFLRCVACCLCVAAAAAAAAGDHLPRLSGLVHPQNQNDERNAECDTRDCGEALGPPENGWRKRRGGGGRGGVLRGAEELPR